MKDDVCDCLGSRRRYSYLTVKLPARPALKSRVASHRAAAREPALARCRKRKARADMLGFERRKIH